MDVFGYVGSVLRSTSKYLNGRRREKYEGDRFEEWVVSNSNIRKRPEVEDNRSYWRLLEWRSDKYVDGWYALSNIAPDLVLECTKREDDSSKVRTIAIECKYRNSMHNFWLEKRQVLNYEHFCRERNPIIDDLYYLFGFQWEDGAPKELYLIPSTALYTYDEEEDLVDFSCSERKTKGALWYAPYRVILDPENGKKYIQYRDKQRNDK